MWVLSITCREAAEELLQQYSDVVRWTLLTAGGYECQEQEGNYMIAFLSAATAVEWALLVQEALLEVKWSIQVWLQRKQQQQWPACAEAADSTGKGVSASCVVNLSALQHQRQHDYSCLR